MRKGSGNPFGFPELNPQTEFTSVEENSLSPQGTDLFILLSINSKS